MSFFKSIFLSQEENEKLKDSKPEESKKQSVEDLSSKVQNFTIPQNINIPTQPSVGTPSQSFQPTIQEDPEIKKRFDDFLTSINLPGYDFLEFFNAVKNFEDANSYKTALSVASSFDASLNKEKLVKDSNFYIDSINKIVDEQRGQSQSRISSLNTDYNKTITDINKKMEDLQRKLIEIQNEIGTLAGQKPIIESKYQQDVEEVNRKMSTLVYYQEQIVNQINKVKTNIQNYL